MDRFSKLFILGAAAAMIGIQIWLLNGSWPGFWWLAVALIAGASLASAYDRRAVAAVLVFAYAFPLVIRLLHGRYHVYYGLLWLGPLFGALLPQAATTAWHVPRRWRVPLVAWALVVIAASAITMARESDFYWGLWFHEHVAAPLFAASWILHIALAFLVGILWFDWLCAQSERDLRRSVVVPLAVGTLPLAGVALYQALFDITFYNESTYWTLGRATGTMFDANVCAAIAAFWIGGAALVGERAGRARWPLTAAGIVLMWLTVWSTASRTGFGLAIAATIGVGIAMWRDREGRLRFTWKSAALAVAAVVVAAVLFTILRSNGTGPLQRLGRMFADGSGSSIAAVIRELWNRNGYGEAATILIRRYPWFGIGIGTFHEMGYFVGTNELHLLTAPDNAQNWYRHLFVEFGLLGSLPWIVWTVLFAAFVLRRENAETKIRTALRGVLIGFAAVSLVGMPGQDVSVAMTFWSFAAFYVVIGRGAPVRVPPAEARSPRGLWAAIAVLILVFSAGTLRAGIIELAASLRARDNGQDFAYGFNPAEPDGAGGVQRWARRRGVMTIQPTAPVMLLTIAVNHLDLDRAPVHARVWIDRSLVFDGRLTTPQAIVKTIPVPSNGRRILLRSEVDRVVRPRDSGIDDGRELGLLLGWRFAAPGR